MRAKFALRDRASGGRVRFILRVVILTAGAITALAAPAQASSIFFIRSNDIWVANPDGSAAHQVTTDGGNGYPYVSVSAAKGTEKLAYLRDNPANNPRQMFGTLNPDGTGATTNPDNANMQPIGGSDGRTVSIASGGDRIAWPKSYLFCFNFTCDTHFAPYSEGVDGTNQQHIVGSEATNVTFGDTAGQSLLFNDLGIGANWGDQPAGCQSTTTRYVLVRQTPAPTGGTAGTPSVYCVPNLDLVAPALRPDGQVIAAVQSDNLADGTQSIVTMQLDGVATGSSATPVTQVTSPGTAETPDFSPDGTQIAFEGAGNTIDKVPATGGAATQILTNATSPAWSPYTLPGGGPVSPGGGAGSGDTGQQPGGGSGQQQGGGGSGQTGGQCTVPKLKGDTVAKARAALSKARCTLGSTRKAFSRSVKRGRVIAQSPTPGTVVPAGTRVAITVSKGKKKP